MWLEIISHHPDVWGILDVQPQVNDFKTDIEEALQKSLVHVK